MTETTLRERMARTIAAVIHRALGDGLEDPKQPVMGDRRKVAEDAAEAAIAAIRPGDIFGDGLMAVRRDAVPAENEGRGTRLQ